jgi:hypothetical protein
MGGTIMEKNKGTYRVLIYFCMLVPLYCPDDVLDPATKHEEGTDGEESDQGKRRATA